MPQPIPDPGNINNLNEYKELFTEIEGISGKIKDIIKDQHLVGVAASNARGTYTDINKQLKNLVKLGSEWNNGWIKQSSILKAIRANENSLTALTKQKAKAIADQNARLAGQIHLAIKNLDRQRLELDALKEGNRELEKRIGITGSILKGLKKIPVLGEVLQIEEALEEMNKAAKNGAGAFKVAFVGVKTALEDVFEKVSFAALLGMWIKMGFEANKQATMFQKTLIMSTKEATSMREKFAATSRDLNDSSVTTNRLIEANLKLSELLGINQVYSKDINVEFVRLTKNMGLSEEAAAGLAKYSILTGETLKHTKESMLGIVQSVGSQYGVQLNNKKILELTTKISGQLLANFRANPKALAEAVAHTDALGTSLETVRAQAESLLNFESSIENELKAELLLGQTMNLERARASALAGDHLSVMKELNEQGMDFSKYSKLNVLQQQAFAQALGLSSDQLSDQLLKQQFLGKSRSEILALAGEEVAQRMESLSAADKFNNSMDKLKDIIGNLVAGPFGQLLGMSVDFLNNILAVVAPIMSFAQTLGSALGFIGRLIDKLGVVGKIMKGIASIAIIFAAYKAYASLAVTPIIGPLLGAAAAAAVSAAGFSALNGKATSIQDGFIDPQNDTVITGPAGTFKTRADDKILVGTEVTPEKGAGRITANANSIDIQPIIQALREVKASVDRLNAKESGVYLDGRKVGTSLVQGTSKLA